jgi:glycosyltransferase involved in cell wall biosynthesis
MYVFGGKMKNVLTVSTYSPTSQGFGGITRTVTAYLSALSSTDNKISYVGPNSSLTGYVTKAGIKKILPTVNIYLYTPWLHKKWGIGPGILRHLDKIVSADVIFIHGVRTMPTSLFGIVARLLRKRYYIVAHAGLDQQRMNRTFQKHPIIFRLFELFVSISINGAERIIVSGHSEEATLHPTFKKRPVLRVENFFENPLPFAEPTDISKGKRYIFVGRVDSDKGILAFVRVWKAEASPGDRLTILGSGSGDYAEKLYREVKDDGRINNVGEVEHEMVPAFLTDSHVLVLPTGLDDPVTENFGNVVAEVLRSSRPAMVTIGMHWDQYSDSSAVMLFEPNLEGARQIIKYFSEIDQDIYRGMCVAAYNLGERFSSAHAKQKLQSLIDEISR